MTSQDRIISDSWALFRPDNQIAGDGESQLCDYTTKEDAESVLSPTEEHDIAWLEYLKSINRCESFRVGRVRLIEVAE